MVIGMATGSRVRPAQARETGPKPLSNVRAWEQVTQKADGQGTELQHRGVRKAPKGRAM